jgi:transcriptional regulator
MYIPRHFTHTDQQSQFELIRSAPLASLVVHTPEGLVANHVPFVLDVENLETVKLLAHIPRANPLSGHLTEVTECLAIFHGPQGYVSPSWYATKREHGKVVPTWNYLVVHAHGSIRLVDDSTWIMRQVNMLTELMEGERSVPWAVADAPGEFTERLARSLVGLELTVSRLEAKNKASQNQPEENQRSVLAALNAEAKDSDFAGHMREMLKRD